LSADVLALIDGDCPTCGDPYVAGSYQQSVWTTGDEHGVWCTIEPEDLPDKGLPRYRSSQLFVKKPSAGIVYYIPRPVTEQTMIQVRVE
jgi:hypothetical protein